VRLHQKICIVTGAGSGIGRATALLFAREGATVVAVDLSGQEAAKTQGLIEQQGGICQVAEVDVSCEHAVANLVQSTVEQFGQLDVLHNNAGVSLLKPITETTEADIDWLLGVNLKGVVFGCKYAIPQMVKQGGGSIINTGSELAIVGQPLYSVYCASKGAVLALTRALAVEWAAQGVRINAVCPGPVKTPMLQAEFDRADDPSAEELAAIQTIPAGRLGTPEDIACVVLFLASEDAQFVHGAAIMIDGAKTVI
jgi:3-oxoacyl-[acyl-carrier protein] reductase